MKSLAQITLYTPGKPATNIALEIDHSSIYNGLQTAILELHQQFAIRREQINPGFQSANLELTNGRTMFVKMES